MFVNQLICCLEYIYSKNIIHRDIKPKNCLINIEKHKNQVYVIDLSLATKRCVVQIKVIVGRSLNSKLIEMARFVSINSYIDIGKYNVLDSCDFKANSFPSATSLQ